MEKNDNLQVDIQEYKKSYINTEYDLDRIIYDLDSNIDLRSSQAERFDNLTFSPYKGRSCFKV